MKTITVFSRQEFREWLAKNHDKEEKISVILHKKHTGKSSPSHRELIEEAICYGWIVGAIQTTGQSLQFCKDQSQQDSR